MADLLDKMLSSTEKKVFAGDLKGGGNRFRHELKYFISYNYREILKQKLGNLIHVDSHAEGGMYKIRSLYFDDYFDTAYEEKEMGIAARSKFRIRVYNDTDKTIRLEEKIKSGSFIKKVSAKLTRAETEMILEGRYDFLRDNPQPLCKKFYVKCVSEMMRPRVIVDYEREPYVFDAGEVRITFDMNIRAGVLGYSLFDHELPTISTMESDKLVLEVKYTELLPTFIKRALPSGGTELSAISKYIMCRDVTNYMTTQPFMIM